MINRLFRFVRVEHTIFSLPLLFTGAWIGGRSKLPSLTILILILAAGTGARTLGMAMNRILDRKLDAKNPRTSTRELPSGTLSLPKAYLVALVGLVVYIAACLLIGRTCTLLSPILAVLLISYSLLKRITCFCHFGIGLVIAMAPIGAYIAVNDGAVFHLDLNLHILLLSLFSFCWISSFDIIYALQDVESDRITGVKSLPACFGPGPALCIGSGLHLLGLLALAGLVWKLSGGLFAWTTFLAACTATGLAYLPWIPLSFRFFPLSAIAGILGALAPLLGGF